MPYWMRDGKIVVDGDGQPLLCDECPCDDCTLCTWSCGINPDGPISPGATLTIDLPTLTDGECSECDALPSTLELCWSDQDAAFDGGCSAWHVPIDDEDCELGVTLYQDGDGVWHLDFYWIDGVNLNLEAGYELLCAEWIPGTTVTFDLVDSPPVDARCDGWPATLDVTLSWGNCECGEGIEPPCQYTLEVGDVDDDGCSGCDVHYPPDPITLTYSPGTGIDNLCCAWWGSFWSTLPTPLLCGIGVPAPQPLVVLYLDGSDYVLDIGYTGGTPIARYRLAASSWDCEGENEMDFDSSTTTCSWPSTVTVTSSLYVAP